MTAPLIFLTVPALRDGDVERMPNLQSLMADGGKTVVTPRFPAVTWPAQANMLTGAMPDEHGVVANGFYWREKNEVEMWTAWNEVIQRPQLWDVLGEKGLKTAAWFPMLSKGCSADHVCMPAPIHKPDGSEDLWCYTKPQEFYGELLDSIGHFPLQHFWGPLSNIKSSKWIADSAVAAAQKFAPDFFYIYLPHLDYAAQKNGPNSDEALAAVTALDQLLGELIAQMNDAYTDNPQWIVASEYVITEVDHVTYPNRILRDAGLVEFTTDQQGREQLDFAASRAWALVDHQFSHIFVKDSDPQTIATVVELFKDAEGIAQVLDRSEQESMNFYHERSGDVMLVSTANSWQAYYWWNDDKCAPEYAGRVDIHNKPGYDPVELCFDMATKSVPLDATLIKGSHGAGPTSGEGQQAVLLSTAAGIIDRSEIADTDVFQMVIDYFSE